VVPRNGGIKAAYYTITDSDGSGGTFDVSGMFNHLYSVLLTDITTAIYVSTLWSEDSESITIGGEATAGDTYKVTVEGT